MLKNCLKGQQSTTVKASPVFVLCTSLSSGVPYYEYYDCALTDDDDSNGDNVKELGDIIATCFLAPYSPGEICASHANLPF